MTSARGRREAKNTEIGPIIAAAKAYLGLDEKASMPVARRRRFASIGNLLCFCSALALSK